MNRIETEGYLLHICRRSEWDAAQSSGEYRALSLEVEGFIHCSLENQILEVANQFYRGIPDLVLLWIDAHRVNSQIVFERPAGESGQLFPHIYGPVQLEAVISAQAFPASVDGYFYSIPQRPERPNL